ncbi:MAG: orotidine-5'-phosphate decarboxylase [Christensenellales bacterium]|jgi:orotidine-5'-phosphate decarboxylase
MIIDRLIDAIEEKRNPTAAGLDTLLEHLPDDLLNSRRIETLEDAADVMFEFNAAIIDALHEIVPCVKIQSACYEMYGPAGVSCMKKTIDYAAGRNLIVIADCKRNDIGSTAAAYASAYIGGTKLPGGEAKAFGADFVTVTAYLGEDGIKPFTDACKKYDKGIFVLVKTSNPSSGQLQDIECGGRTVYRIMGEMVEGWGKDLIGASGYSSVGAVVGATYPSQGAELRRALPSVFFLVPGYGAQGATGKDIAGCFDKDGRGAVVNASRSLLCAHKKWPGISFFEAARREAIKMRDDLRANI